MSDPTILAASVSLGVSLLAAAIVGLSRRAVKEQDRRIEVNEARISDAERVNRQQADALSELRLHLAQNHPDNADFGEVKTAIRDLTSAVVTLTTRIEVLTATR